MAGILKSNAVSTEKKKKARIPLSAWLSYLFIAAMVVGTISLARYTATSSESGSLRIANFSVSASMLSGANNEIILNDGGKCRFEVSNDSEVAVEFRVILKDLPEGVTVGLSVGEESSAEYNIGKSASEFIILESGTTEVCELSFDAPEDVTGTHNVSVQVQFRQID